MNGILALFLATLTLCAWHVVTIEQAAKEAHFPEAKGLVASHRLAPRIMVACAEIRDLPARGNQSMT
jgi:hypothetical protein